MSAKFQTKGPFQVPFTQKARVQRIEKGNISEFWQKNKQISKEKGCYAFLIRVRHGVLPYYVGKATKSFFQEVFTDDKLEKYNSALSEYSFAVAPEMLFLSYQKDGRGRDNRSAIGDLEKTLTFLATIRNEKLKNVRNTGTDDDFEIAGLKARGARPKELQYLIKVFGDLSKRR